MLVCILCALGVQIGCARAQTHIPTQKEPINQRFKPRGETQLRMGTERTILEGKIWVPLAQEYNRVAYGDARISGDWDNNLEGNIGFGYRTMERAKHIIGGSIWYDHRKTERGSQFSQITLGGEVMTEDYDVRINAYVPLSGKHRYDLGGAASTTPYLADTGIYYDANGFLIEKAQRGLDLEVGYRIPMWQQEIERVRVLGAVYGFKADGTESVVGGRIRTQVDITPDVSIGARFQYDAPRGSQSFADVTVRFPFGSKRSIRTEGLRARMDEFSERDIDIVTSSKEFAPQSGVPVLNAETKQMQRVLYVDNSNGAAGDGSFENPFNNLAAAQAVLQDHDTVYVFAGTGNSTNMDQGFVIDKRNVSMIGAGVDFVYENGRYLAPRSAFTGTLLLVADSNPIITNINAPADGTDLLTGNGVLITGNDASIAGVTVDGAAYVGVRFLADGVHLGTATASRIRVENSGSSGIVFQALDGGSFSHVLLEDSFSLNNTALVSNGSGVVATIAGNSHYGILEMNRNVASGNSSTGINLNFSSTGTTDAYTEQIILTDNRTDGNGGNGLNIAAARGTHRFIRVHSHESHNNTAQGVSISATSDGTIGDVAVYDSVISGNRDGIQLSTATNGTMNSAAVIGSTITATTRDGMMISNAPNVRIEDTVIDGAARHGMLATSSNAPVNNLVMQDVRVINSQMDGINIAVSGTSQLSGYALSSTFADNGIVSNGVTNYYGVNINHTSSAVLLFHLGNGSQSGNNRIFGQPFTDIRVNIGNNILSAAHNWWGDMNGLQPGQVALVGASTVSATPFLPSDPYVP